VFEEPGISAGLDCGASTAVGVGGDDVVLGGDAGIGFEMGADIAGGVRFCVDDDAALDSPSRLNTPPKLVPGRLSEEVELEDASVCRERVLNIRREVCPTELTGCEMLRAREESPELDAE